MKIFESSPAAGGAWSLSPTPNELDLQKCFAPKHNPGYAHFEASIIPFVRARFQALFSL